MVCFPFYQGHISGSSASCKDNWMAVPRFGGWDKKSGTPDYSMVFSRARANRKYQKSEGRLASFGTESDLLTYQHYDDDDEPVKVYFSFNNFFS